MVIEVILHLLGQFPWLHAREPLDVPSYPNLPLTTTGEERHAVPSKAHPFLFLRFQVANLSLAARRERGAHHLILVIGECDKSLIIFE